MSVIEDRILSMRFDNKQFEAGVKITMGTLKLLQNSLNFSGGSKGIDDAQAAVNRFSMAGMGSAVEGISGKFLALSTVAITALTNITNKAVDAGIAMGKSLTIDPIMDGFAEYELKMGSIQTILANTSRHGTGLKEVTASLDDLNTYADKTIYNFGDMTRNIGLFTNAGIGIEESTSMIKGFSNEAAASGTTSQGAAGAAYQLSQALSAGTIRLMDWRSLTNVGMGNKNMQNGIIEIADAMGELDKAGISATEIQEDFNGSLEKNWLSADVMSKYLGIMAGDIDEAAMSSMGLTDAQISMFKTQQTNAEEAATKVRTWTQLIGTLQEAVGSTWAQTFDILLGDFEQATELFSGIESTLSPMIGAFGDARNKLLQSWADMGGRGMAIEGMKNVFTALRLILMKVGEAFRQIFPPMTVDQLVKMTSGFRRFTETLIASGETLGKIRRTFAGVFAIFGIGWEVIKGLFSGVMQLFGGFQTGAGGILSFTAALGDWLVNLHAGIKESGIFTKIFEGLGSVLALPIKLLSGLGGVLVGLMSGFTQVGSAAKTVTDILFSGDFKGGPWDEDSPIIDVLFKIREGFVSAGGAVKDFLGGLKDSFSAGNLTALLGAGAAGGLALAIRNVLKNGISFGFKGQDTLFESLTGMFDGIKGSFESVSGIVDSLTGALTTMQNNIKANIILKIAIAVGVLAGAMKLLSTLDAGQIATSMGAIVTGLGTLMGAMAILAKLAGSAGFLAIPSLATAMLTLSVAVLILATSVKVLATLSWDELLRGLVGLAGVLGAVVIAAMGLSKVQGSILRTAFALIPLAIGVRILVESVKALSDLSWGEMIQGVAGLGGVLVVLAGALRLMPTNMAATGAGLILVGAGMKVISSAVSSMGEMDLGTLVQGILGLGGALLIIAGALRLMPKNMAVMGVGLVLVAGAIQLISSAITMMGGMGWEELVRGLVGLAGALGVLAIALMFMNGTVAGSAALLMAGAAIAMLVPPLILMGSLSWESIVKGMVGLAGALTIIGVAGLLLTPLVPTLLGLGAALILFGIALGAAGLGAQAFVTALTMFVKLIDTSKNSLIGLMDMIPLMAAKLAEGILAFATTISANAATFVGAFKDLIIALLDAIIEIAPKIGEALTALLQTLVQIIITNAPAIGQAVTVLIDTFLTTVVTNAPKIVNAIFTVMMSFLQTIRDRVPEVVTAVTDIIVAFIGAIAANLPRITQAAFDLIITFINGLTTAINNNSETMRTAGLNLALAIVDGITGGLGSAVRRVANKAAELARGALNAAKEALGINSPSKEFIAVGEFSGEGFVVGMDNSTRDVRESATAMGETALYGAREGVAGIESIFGGVGAAAQEMYNILALGDFKGTGPWAEDSQMVNRLFDIREGFTYVGRAAEEATGILAFGNFKGGVWDEDSQIVDTLFTMREGFEDVQKTATSTYDILTKGDYTGGMWSEDSPVVDGLFKIREAFGPDAAKEFQNVGNNIVEGFVVGVENGQGAFHKAIADMSNGALQTARDVLGIRSPSREFEKIGEYSADGIVKGANNKSGEVKGAGNNLATNLMMGFTKGVGKEMPKALESIFNTIENGTADAKFWGPNSPVTTQLMGMNEALQGVNLQLAAFYGEVDLANPDSIAEYTEKAGKSLTHLTGLFNGLQQAAGTAFGMLKDGKGLDQVLGSEDVLSQILGAMLTLLPGVEGAAISIGLAIVDGLLSTFMGPGTTVLGLIGDFLSGAVRWIGGLFGIKFPVEEEVKKGEEAVEDFLVTVEDGHGRFQKLTEAGIEALTETLSNVDDLLNGDRDPRITPILDLTQFNKDHSKMLQTLEPPVDISMNTSNAQATGLYNMQQEIAAAQADIAPAASITNIELTQNNSSPKALSHVEIYRQTKSQLSLAKEALNV